MPVSSTPPLGRTVAVGSACGSVMRRAVCAGAHGIKPSVETPPAGATHGLQRQLRVASGCLPALAMEKAKLLIGSGALRRPSVLLPGWFCATLPAGAQRPCESPLHGDKP